MAHSIKMVYVVHHSHTDIGYTDLQERVIAIQVNYIKTVLSMMRQPEYADFRWNCETLYCVEEFWKQASEDDRADFARFVKEGKIGISANYLNFNDLVNADVFGNASASGGAVLFLRGAPRTGSQYSRQTRRNAHRKTDGNHLHGTWSCVHPVASALQPCRYSKS